MTRLPRARSAPNSLSTPKRKVRPRPRKIVGDALIRPALLGLLIAVTTTPGTGWRTSRFLTADSVGKIERPTSSGAKLAGSCSLTTRRWADDAGRLAREKSLPGRVAYVLCRRDGGMYVAVVHFQHPVDGYRIASWYPRETFFGALPAREAARIDYVDDLGHRRGYGIVDNGGRAEFYDEDSRRTGYGLLDRSSGQVERFDLRGQRQEPIAMPIPPDGR